MVKWKAHYTDAHHDLDIDIINTEEDYSADPLSFNINGISFCGTSLGDFQLSNPGMYEAAKKEFCILKWGGKSTKYGMESDYYYDLQRYSLDVQIPVNILRKSDNRILQGILQVFFDYCEHNPQKPQSIRMCDDTRVFCDDVRTAVFTLHIDGKKYSVDSDSLCFESSLIQLCKMIENDYVWKCCFTCQYSDYSPYGCDDYGTMMCYRHHKAEYLKVNDKAGYFRYLEGLGYELKQETYFCSEYASRNQCSGYRGFIE